MDDAKEHSIKWLNLNKLAKTITAPLKGASIEILYFTAYATEMFKQAQFADIISDSKGNVICNKPDKYK